MITAVVEVDANGADTAAVETVEESAGRLGWLFREEEMEEEEVRLAFFLEQPPTGIFLRAPPLVQYLRQFLQKWRG